MSAIIPPLRAGSSRWGALLTRDYFPQLDPYIQWLRQPIGWFVLGAVASGLVGAFLSPLAWSMAAGLVALLLIGVSYPWLCIHGTTCQLACEVLEFEEGQAPLVTVTIHNRYPWPVCGLIVEGLTATPVEHADQDDPREGDIALGTIPWLSRATFQVNLQTHYRGRYPLKVPKLSCAFPLAIWTARKPVAQVASILVRPQQLQLIGPTQVQGDHQHHVGDGTRPGGYSEFIGLRSYQPGDSLRSIHWAHTARTGSIVVCQRGAAERATWSIVLDPRCDQKTLWSRDNLAWRVRLAASLCRMLHDQRIPFELEILGEENWNAQLQSSLSSLESSVDRLTDVPLDGIHFTAVNHGHLAIPALTNTHQSQHACALIIEPARANHSRSYPSAFDDNQIQLSFQQSTGGRSRGGHSSKTVIDLAQDPTEQVIGWLQRWDYGLDAA